MKYCIECTKNVSQNTLTISGVWTIDNIAFIANETQKKLICSPFTKDNIAVSAGASTTVVTVPTNVCELAADDLITFMIDDFKSSQDIINGANTKTIEVGGKVDTVGLKVDTVDGKVDLVGTGVATVGGVVDTVKTTTDNIKLDTESLKTSATSAATDLASLKANIGDKAAGDLTIRQLLAAIKSDALTAQQLTDAKTAITDLIGAASDSKTAATVFGKIAAMKEILDIINASVGVDADAATLHAKIDEVKLMVQTFAYGYALEPNSDGTDTYTLNLDKSASIEGRTLNIA